MYQPKTKEQLEWFINGVISLFEDLNSPIDEEKVMGFVITETENSFKVDFTCVSVIIPSTHEDPDKDNSHEDNYDSHFTWYKNERLSKLVTYITHEIETIHEMAISRDWDDIVNREFGE